MKRLFFIMAFTIAFSFTMTPEALADPWICVGKPTDEYIEAFAIKSQTAYAVTDTGVYLKQDCLNPQSQWQEITGNIELSGYFCSIDVAVNPYYTDSVTIFVGTYLVSPKLWKSCDQGSTWVICHEQMLQPYRLVVVDPKDWRKVWVSTFPGLIVSEDGGGNWTSVDPPDYQYISAICFDPVDPLTVYVSTEAYEPHYGSVFKTTDGGKSWEEKNQGLPWEVSIGTICADPQTPGILYTVPTWVDSLTVYKTTDGGESWEGRRITEGTGCWVADIQVHPCYPNVLYLGTCGAGGFYQSFNWASTWSTISNDGVKQIVINKQEPEKIYALFEDGIWCYEDPLVPVEEDSGPDLQLPDRYTLLQNYPNPFNTQTVITYRLPQASPVILSIYNLLGQEVKTLVDERQQAGSHQVCWQGEDAQGEAVASGVYFCRLQVAGYTETNKMILLR